MRKNLPTLVLVSASLVALPPVSLAGQSEHSGHHPPEGSTQIVHTPPSIAEEHRKLHETLSRAAAERGEVGRAAQELERALGPHFQREEEIATPPLGLLPSLASGPATADMRVVLSMTQALERELPQMMREHDVIRGAVREFRAAADRAGLGEYVRFSDDLAAHARQEEEILYPAAILVGRYIEQTAPQR